MKTEKKVETKWSQKEVFYLLYRDNNGYWIGQNDRQQEDVWRYTASTECPVYHNWDSQQPNGGREQNCLVMLKKSSGKFQDKACNGNFNALCKFKRGKSVIVVITLYILNSNGLKNDKNNNNTNDNNTDDNNDNNGDNGHLSSVNEKRPPLRQHF